MYNLLIVDDEPLILESLYQLLLRKRGDRFWVYKAESASRALKLFEEKRIDLLMTDICMPGMDGIALRDRVQEQWPECRTIFLTGQKEFAYAKAAVNDSTISFVLKMEGDDAIFEVVDYAYECIDRLYLEKGQFLKLHQDFQEVMPVLRREIMEQIVYMGWSAQQLEKGKKQIQIVNDRFDLEQPFFLVLISFSQEDILEQEQIKRIFESALGGYAQLDAFLESGLLVLLLQGEARLDRVKGFLEIGFHICEKMNLSQPGIFIYEKTVTCAETPHIFHIVNCKRLELDTNNEICICRMPEPERKKQMLHHQYFGETIDEEKMAESLRYTDRAVFFDLVDQVIANEAYHGAGSFLLIGARLLTAIIRYLPEECGVLERINLDKLANYNRHMNFHEAIEYLRFAAETYFKERELQQTDAKDCIVSQVKKYVNQHLAEDVSLVSLGDHVGLSPAYLSRIYKEITGVSINQYVANKRISMAKELLADETIRMQTIAEQIGLRSASYFTHYFKRHTGITPQEYRKKGSEPDREKRGGSNGDFN